MYKPEKIPLLEQSRIVDLKILELFDRMNKNLSDPENVDKEKAYDQIEELRILKQEVRNISQKMKDLNAIVCDPHRYAERKKKREEGN